VGFYSAVPRARDGLLTFYVNPCRKIRRPAS
jgi:hypothetical protein